MAPFRVHALSLVILALALPVPSIWAAHMLSSKARWLVCSWFALAAMLAWDTTAHFVIVKAEPFFILLNNPMAYILGISVMACLSYVLSRLTSLPNPSFKRRNI